jgi:hypothetical protein
MATTALSPATSEAKPSPPPSGAVTAKALAGIKAGDFDFVDGGVYTYRGTTEVKGTPSNALVSRRVRLHDTLSGRVVSEQWSVAATGTFTFTGLRLGSFYAVGFDHTGTYNGVIATNIPAELV